MIGGNQSVKQKSTLLLTRCFRNILKKDYHFLKLRLPPPEEEFLLPRSSFSLATETLSDLPSISFPSIPCIACLAADSSGISTNPKPRERPVSLSVITFAEDTSPNSLNKFLKSSSVV